MAHSPALLAALLLLCSPCQAAGKCVEDHSLGKCAPCLNGDQCEEGRFCCPFMKKCVKDSNEACSYPVASCIPLCFDNMDQDDCKCENKDFPKNWVQCTGDEGAQEVSAKEHEPEPDPIRKAFAHNGECVGIFGDTWCWLADDKGEKAKRGQPYSCKSYIGFSAEDWCWRPAPAGNDEEVSGSATGGVGGSQAETALDHFACPAKWYSGDSAGDEEAEKWTMAHNVYRCMHDVEFVQWSGPMAASIEDWLKDKSSMVHSNSYDIEPPAGPAGENLFSGQPASYWKPWQAVTSWYNEVEQCSHFPGCGGRFSPGTGHFTAMIWAGAREIGCYSNDYGVKGCRYRGGDSKDCSTPNMGGCYEKNLPQKTVDLETCKAKVQECFGGKELPAEMQAFAVEDVETASSRSPLRFAALSPAVAALVGVAVLGALLAVAWRVVGRGRPRPAANAGEEAWLQLEELKEPVTEDEDK